MPADRRARTDSEDTLFVPIGRRIESEREGLDFFALEGPFARAASPESTPARMRPDPPEPFAAPSSEPLAKPSRADAALWESARNVFRDNSLLARALPVFRLLVGVTRHRAHPDSLHGDFVAALRDFESSQPLQALPAQNRTMLVYALAATADDIVLNSQNGDQSRWASNTLVSTFFRETLGGERFFALLGHLMSSPQASLRELEVFHYCLQFGFEGKYRLEKNRIGELASLKADLFRILAAARGEPAAELSPHWHPATLLRRLPPNYGLFAKLVSVVAFALVLVLLALRYWSLNLADDASRRIAELVEVTKSIVPPARTVATQAVTLVPNATTPAVNPPAPSTESSYALLSRLLAKERDSGMIEVIDGPSIVIRTLKEVFPSASATIDPAYKPVVDAIASALNRLAGRIQVVGYTDSLPIRSATFGSNMALSSARAEEIRKLMLNGIQNGSRLSSRGMGDQSPIADNATPAGRARNRRVEIVFSEMK